MFNLSVLDISVMVFYAIAIIAYGLYKGKRESSEEYFLGGRSMTWPIVGISLFAANISSSTLVGLAGDAYKTNVHVFNYEWLAVIVLIIFAIFFMPFYIKSKVYTMPEFLERRYDSRSRYYFSFITLIGNVIIDTAAGLYVGMLVLKIVFPEMDTWQIISILAISAAAYTIPGGLSSVIHTEVIQAILLVIGSCILTYYCYDAVGGWDALITKLEGMKGTAPVMDKTPDEIFSLVRPIGSLDYEGNEFMSWRGLLFGAPILGFYFWANNQFMVQRVLSAKDLNHGRWGALFAGLLKLPVLFIMVLPGVFAIVMFSDLDLTALNYGDCDNLADCPNMTYPVLLFQLLPSGLLGLVLAGLLAAMMSSVSATFNSASTLITMDFIQKAKPDMTSKQLVRTGQIATLFLVVLAAAWAPQIERFGSLFQYLQLVLAFICPPVVAVFVLGLFWKRASANGAFAALMTGFAIAIFLLFSNVYELSPYINDIHFLDRAALLLLICSIVHIGVSLMTKGPNEEVIRQYTWRKSVWTEETAELADLPWYKNYRILSLILLIITIALVAWWW
ncbi:MAG: SSS family solute:Na+ symporter [Saprospiraceae bacterium]|jgi:SSS family solute:Na+ symporter